MKGPKIKFRPRDEKLEELRAEVLELLGQVNQQERRIRAVEISRDIAKTALWVSIVAIGALAKSSEVSNIGMLGLGLPTIDPYTDILSVAKKVASHARAKVT